MFYINKTTEVTAREFKFGTVEGISLGEHGRGRQTDLSTNSARVGRSCWWFEDRSHDWLVKGWQTAH